MFSRIPFEKVNWPTSLFLIGTLFLSLTAVPAYLCLFGIDWFQVVLFFAHVLRLRIFHYGRLPSALLASHFPGALDRAALHAYLWRGRL